MPARCQVLQTEQGEHIPNFWSFRPNGEELINMWTSKMFADKSNEENKTELEAESERVGENG